jgi:hypothetical protein
MFYIINKITAEVNDIIYTSIGYVESQDDSIYLDNFETFMSWYDANLEDIKTETLIIEDWITTNPTIYSGSQGTEVRPDNVNLIVDLDNPEGGV